MRNRNPIFFLFIVYTFIIFAGGYWMGRTGWPLIQLGVATSTVPPEARETFAPFWEVWNLVDDRYYDQPVDPVAMTEGAIRGMLDTLDDPNTRYLPPAAEESARQSMEGELEGIGVRVEYVDGNVTVVSPFEGSPADEAGLQPGDVLREADGVNLTGIGLTEAAELIRGPAGTTVHLVVERNGETFEVDVERDVISIPSVRSEMLEQDVGYVRVNRFSNPTPEELRTALEDLMAENPEGLILDLRNNPGGGLDTAVDVADQFLAEGTILIERFGDGEERVFEASGEGLAQDVPIAVLVNEGSASASEVVAGALRDHDRATLIGTTTFGKGTVQTWHALSNGGGVRITFARWLTPDGTWVTEGGLEPDIMVQRAEEGEEPAEGAEPQDAQLDAAINFLSDR
ncbi:MAG: S41 family peptidase [Candidatus Promineifilaceae bacterium]|nr:S41 family peptidase [Candidatus Promineifilaceae bacterium]